MIHLPTAIGGAEDSDRAVRDTLSRVGDRWTIYVVRALRDGPKRFNQLKRKVRAISSRMLTLTLKKLERDGIVSRNAAASSPSRVEYCLTQLGVTLLDPIGALVVWADHHGPEVEAARERYDTTQVEAATRSSHEGSPDPDRTNA
jgi:DNA-binding HxlR family transcriptional regulator